MGRRSYPCWSGGSRQNQGNECEACAKSANASVQIQWGWSRSDDEWYDVCSRHAQMAREKVTRFIAHVSSKEKFLKEQYHDRQP